MAAEIHHGSDDDVVSTATSSPQPAASEPALHNRLSREHRRLLELVARGEPAGQCLEQLCLAVEHVDPRVRAWMLLANAERTYFPRVVAPRFPELAEAICQVPIGDGSVAPCAQVVVSGQPAACSDVAGDPRWHEDWKALCLSNSIRAGYSSPIVEAEALPLGSVFLCFEDPKEPTEWDRALADMATGVAAVILARERSDEALAQARRALAAELEAARHLHGVSTQLIQADDIDALYDRILETAVAIMRADFASFQMLHPERGEGGELRLLGHRGFNPEAARFWEWVRPDSASACGTALRSGRRAVVTDVEHCEFMTGSEDLRIFRATGIRAVQTTPLVSRSGDILGMISTHWSEPHAPSENELRSLDVLARQAADLIERMRHEDALQESNRRKDESLAKLTEARKEAELQKQHLVSLFAQTPTPIAILRGEKHVVEFANAHCLQLWSRRRDDVIDKPIVEALPELRDQPFPDLLERVRRTGEPYVGKEAPAALDLNGDGKLQDVFLNFVYAPLRNVRNEIDGVLVIAFDVTDEILARDRMGELRAEAEVANRAKDEFLAMLGHELRNPLAPILTALQLMRLRGGEEVSKERAIIERQAGQLVRLIDDLLDVSRITRGKVKLKKERVEIAEVAAKAIETAGPLLEQRAHELTVNLPRQGLMIEGDIARLTQVVGNLLTNAAKYTEQGGRVSIIGESTDDTIILRIRDSGIGIAPELLPTVFDRFTQGGQSLDRAQGGLGLGLAVARSLVQLHGGSISADSGGEGKGSEFTIRLPAAAPRSAESDEPRPAEPPLPRQSGRRHRILVVDDNQDAAESLAEYLAAVGHVTRVAFDGPEALRIATEFPADVALIDIGLPVLDGYELAQRLRARSDWRQTRLIAVTGYGLGSDRQRSQQAGFDAHLVKPVDLPALQRLLDD
ncbi:MAG TPA: ATP-binding protein [Woeseiaceae bacterium]|nr:ATP-binding protein [Woeseiaceae bacterium]